MDLILFIIFAIIGSIIGIGTGLIPGIHVNNIALIALFLYSEGFNPVALAALIVGTMISHTFFDFIPSTFFGAPEADTALSVLPMHRFLLQGEGYGAIYLTTIGSAMAMLFSIPIIIGYQLILSSIPYDSFKYYIPVILGIIVLYMFYLESKKSIRKMLISTYIFGLAGIFGFIVLRMPQNYNIIPLNLNDGFLFPVFTGLFGFPVLIQSTSTVIPEQKISEMKIKSEFYRSSLLGTLAGSIVGFLPGVTSGIATVLSRAFFKEENTENFVVALGSVNTANALLNLAALFIIMHPRSEAVSSIGNMLKIIPYSLTIHPPPLFILLLLAAFISSSIAFPLTLFTGKLFARGVYRHGSKYGKISRGIILFLIILIFIFSGVIGLFLAGVATLIGLMPSRMKIMRVHLMAVIIVPVLITYLT